VCEQFPSACRDRSHVTNTLLITCSSSAGETECFSPDHLQCKDDYYTPYPSAFWRWKAHMDMTILKNEKAKFKVELGKYLNTYSFYSINAILCAMMI
jgi:hypothetical protein